MNRLIKVLVSVLAFQAALAVLLHFTRRDMAAYASNEKLVALEAASFDKLVIEGGEKPALVLKKNGDAWKLPGHFGFPASKSKLDGFTAKILGFTRSWPVATTKGAAKRFKVRDDGYEKRISFYEGDKKLKTLWLGSSPSFKRVYARVAGGDEIYAVEFSAYEAGLNQDDWSDKNFLHIQQNQIARVKLPALTLERTDGKFVADGLKKSEETVAGEADSLVAKLAGLSFREVLGPVIPQAYRETTPVLNIEITMKSGKNLRYAFLKPKTEDEFFLLKVSSHDYYFKVGKYEVEDLKKETRRKLVRLKKAAEKRG